jgi:hypothetical protein
LGVTGRTPEKVKAAHWQTNADGPDDFLANFSAD